MKKNKNQTIFPIALSGVAIFLATFLFLFVLSTQAAVSKNLNYQGLLADSAGTAVADGSYTLHLKIYTLAGGGSALWSSDPIVTTKNGVFSTLLDVSTLDFDGSNFYLGVAVNADPEMTPRKQLGSVPQAINANNLIGDGLINVTGGATIGGNVGIGTTSPAQKLDVLGHIMFSINATPSTNKSSSIITRQYASETETEGMQVISTFTTASANTLYFGGGASAYNAATALTFWTAANNITRTGTERMRIDSAGNVGIGTTAPNNLLQVAGLLNFNPTLFNTFVGERAGVANTTGYDNFFGGYQAGYYNTTGFSNSALGKEALNSNTTGSYNSALGSYALAFNTTGSSNSAVGVSALADLDIIADDGSGANTAIGFNTGRGIVTGINNTILGANVTGLASNLSNNIILANGTGVIKARHDGTNWNLTGNVGIGTTAPNNLLQVAGLLNFDPTLFNTFVGEDAGAANTTGANNFFGGYQAGYANIGNVDNVFIGYQTGFEAETGWQNTVIGSQAGHGGGAGSANVLLGYRAGSEEITSNNNIGIGGWSLGGWENGVPVSGADNIALGTEALGQLTTGYSNIAIGSSAGVWNTTGYGNNFMGYNSGFSNTTGSYNNFIGRSAGYNNTTGIYNVFFGDETGYTNTVGSRNTFLGDYAGYQNIAGSYNSFIGYSAGTVNDYGIGNTASGYYALAYIDPDGGRITAVTDDGPDAIFASAAHGFIGGESVVIYGESCPGEYKQTGTISANGLDAFFLVVGGTAITYTQDTDQCSWTRADQGFNTATGYNAGRNTTTGGLNVFSGNETGYNNITGSQNVFNGYQAGYLGTTNLGNVMIGHKTGYSFNENYSRGSVLIGELAGEMSTGGNASLFIGSSAGYRNTGNYNIFMGADVGVYNTTGTQNTATGNWSGYANVTGRDNAYYGYESGENNAVGSYNTVMGSFAFQQNTQTNLQSVQISDSDLDTFVEIYYVSHGFTGGETFVLKDAVVNTLTGYNGMSCTVDNVIDADNFDTLCAYSADATVDLYRTDLDEGQRNTALGYEAGLSNLVGSGNLFLGYNAGYNETGSNKLYIENSNSASPLIYGDFTDGSELVRINGNAEINSLNANTTFSIIGDAADTNTANPYIYVIQQGLAQAYTGDGIKMYYDWDGSFAATGNFLTGYNSGTLKTKLQADGGAYFAGSVGIGTTNPVYALDVLGDINVTGNFLVNDVPFSGSSQWTTTGSDIYYDLGNVGIGMTNPTYGLHVSGTLGIGSTAYFASNVGIGTTAPTNLLDVAGGVKIGATYAGMTTIAPVNGLLVQGSVGIGTTAPDGPFQVAGRISFVSGNSSTIIGADAGTSNTGTGNTFIGNGAAYNHLAGGQNTAVGYLALFSDGTNTGHDNVAVGYSALMLNDDGFYNTAVGGNALYSNTDGLQNTAVGFDAVSSNTTGSMNTGFGVRALDRTNTGGWNTAMGVDALSYNTIGYHNTSVGVDALFNNSEGYHNTAMGVEALTQNTYGYENTAIGKRSLINNSTGDRNTAIGKNSLGENSTGNDNIAMGYYAGMYQSDGVSYLSDAEYSIYIGTESRGFSDADSNSIVIGYQAIGLGANTVVLGNDSIVTTALKGSVGIGTTSPAYKLDVVGTLGVGSTAYFASSVGIGTTSPSSLLDLQKSGTSKANEDLLEITNSGNAADMDGTLSSILFNQFYNGGTPASVSSGRISIGTETDWTSTASTQDSFLSLQTALDGTVAEKMRITSGGLVGIGTTNPSYKLDVVGTLGIGSTAYFASSVGIGTTAPDTTLKVVGSICASATDVACAGTTAGAIYADNFIAGGTALNIPDYVFESDYNLMPLDQLAAYIQAHKHLPGVPSADDVERAGGLNLGQMVPAILEKTEENTLYILGLDLKTDSNITTIQGLQTSVDEQLDLISNFQLSISKQFSISNDQISKLKAEDLKFESDLKDQNDLIAILQGQVAELQTRFNTETNLAQIDLNTQSISTLELRLGTNRVTNPEDVDILGKLSAKTLSTGGIEIVMVDPDAKTIGDDFIPSDQNLKFIKTKAAMKNSKIYVTPIGSTDNQVIYIGNIDEANGFEVKVDRLETVLVPNEIKFNWWIVETQ